MANIPRTTFPRGIVQLDPSDPLNQGLVGWWPLDGGSISGTTAPDKSNNFNNGTLVGGPTVVPGPFGGQSTALSFNGSTTYVRLASAPVLNPQTVGISHSAWINGTTWPNAYNAIGHQNTNLFEYFVRSYGKMAWYLGTGDVDGSGIYTLSTGVWYLVTVTWDLVSGTAVGYINGNVDASFGAGTTAPGAALIDIGADNFDGNRFFNGGIAGYRIYNRVLSAAEVYALANPPSNQGLYTPVRTRRIVPGAAPPPPTGRPRVLPILGGASVAPSLDLLLAAGTAKLAHMIKSKEKIKRRGLLGLKPDGIPR